MEQSKSSKRYLLLGLFFCLLAIFFALMYHFNVIKSLDLFLSVTYVAYFAGMALVYNGAYCKERNHTNSKIISYIFGIIFLLVSIVMLIYGFASGQVTLFNSL